MMQTNSIFARWIFINRIFRHLWWIWYGFCIVPTGIFGGMWIFHWRITIGSSIKESGGVNAILGGKLKASIWVDWIILDRRMTILWVLNVTFFYGFYHSKSPWDSGVWGICFFFATTLNKSKQFTMNSITWMPVLFKANPMWTIWEGGKKSWALESFLDMLLEKTIQFGSNVMLGEVCFVFGSCWFCLLHYVFIFFRDGNMSPFVHVWYI